MNLCTYISVCVHSRYATILAFDVKIERDAQELADTLGVKIFQADIIYHLFDKFTAYREELKQRKREEFKNIAVFPCKLRVLPQFIFNSRDPIVMGVMVEAGIIKEGTPICVPSREVNQYSSHNIILNKNTYNITLYPSYILGATIILMLIYYYCILNQLQ